MSGFLGYFKTRRKFAKKKCLAQRTQWMVIIPVRNILWGSMRPNYCIHGMCKESQREVKALPTKRFNDTSPFHFLEFSRHKVFAFLFPLPGMFSLWQLKTVQLAPSAPQVCTQNPLFHEAPTGSHFTSICKCPLIKLPIPLCCYVFPFSTYQSELHFYNSNYYT